MSELLAVIAGLIVVALASRFQTLVGKAAFIVVAAISLTAVAQTVWLQSWRFWAGLAALGLLAAVVSALFGAWRNKDAFHHDPADRDKAVEWLARRRLDAEPRVRPHDG